MLRLFVLTWLVAFAGGPAARAADEKFDTLTVGQQTFTKVVVLNKYQKDVFISHSRGMCSLKVKDLDVATQLKLGYQVELPKPSKRETIEKALQAPDMNNLESDPRMQKLDPETAARVAEVVKKLDPAALWGILIGWVLCYLFFSFLCRCICRKVAAPPTTLMPLVWFPFLKQLPLFQAAGMSPWWILANFFPPAAIVAYVMWSFKVVQARGKHVIFAVMLLLPILHFVSLLYLALSRGCGEDDSETSGIITLQSGPRKEAA
jgi:hypothetical protein